MSMDRCTKGRRKIVIMHPSISSYREFYSLQTNIFCNNFKPSLGLQKLSVMEQVYEILKIILNYYR